MLGKSPLSRISYGQKCYALVRKYWITYQGALVLNGREQTLARAWITIKVDAIAIVIMIFPTIQTYYALLWNFELRTETK